LSVQTIWGKVGVSGAPSSRIPGRIRTRLTRYKFRRIVWSPLGVLDQRLSGSGKTLGGGRAFGFFLWGQIMGTRGGGWHPVSLDTFVDEEGAERKIEPADAKSGLRERESPVLAKVL